MSKSQTHLQALYVCLLDVGFAVTDALFFRRIKQISQLRSMVERMHEIEPGVRFEVPVPPGELRVCMCVLFGPRSLLRLLKDPHLQLFGTRLPRRSAGRDGRA